MTALEKTLNNYQLSSFIKTRPDYPNRYSRRFYIYGHGRAIISIEDLDIQTDIYQKILSDNLSVRETEALVKNYQESLKPKNPLQRKTASFEVEETEKKPSPTISEPR